MDASELVKRLHDERVDVMEGMIDRACLACTISALAEAVARFSDDAATAQRLMDAAKWQDDWCGDCAARAFKIPREQADGERAMREIRQWREKQWRVAP